MEGAAMGDLELAGEMARYRASIYRTISALFLDNPDARTLEGLIEAGRAAADAEPPCASERDFMAALAAVDIGDPEDLRTRVATEYAELFVGPRKPLASPYESIYLGGDRHLLNATTMAVRSVYEDQGYHVARRNQLPDDHIGLEMEFLAHLCDREAACCEAGDEGGARGAQKAEAAFITAHPGRWASLLADRIAATWCGNFYALLARFAVAFLAEDADYLQR